MGRAWLRGLMLALLVAAGPAEVEEKGPSKFPNFPTKTAVPIVDVRATRQLRRPSAAVPQKLPELSDSHWTTAPTRRLRQTTTAPTRASSTTTSSRTTTSSTTTSTSTSTTEYSGAATAWPSPPISANMHPTTTEAPNAAATKNPLLTAMLEAKLRVLKEREMVAQIEQLAGAEEQRRSRGLLRRMGERAELFEHDFEDEGTMMEERSIDGGGGMFEGTPLQSAMAQFFRTSTTTPAPFMLTGNTLGLNATAPAALSDRELIAVTETAARIQKESDRKCIHGCVFLLAPSGSEYRVARSSFHLGLNLPHP